MSWGYEKTGTRSALILDATTYFDNAAEMYKGQAEADDILACKDRVVALVAACILDETANAVTVKASGSHSTSSKGIFNASFSVSVVRVHLAI